MLPVKPIDLKSFGVYASRKKPRLKFSFCLSVPCSIVSMTSARRRICFLWDLFCDKPSPMEDIAVFMGMSIPQGKWLKSGQVDTRRWGFKMQVASRGENPRLADWFYSLGMQVLKHSNYSASSAARRVRLGSDSRTV